MNRIVFLILILALSVLGACSTTAPHTDASPDDRLSEIDAFKQSIPARETASTALSLEDADIGIGFRGVPFGSTMTEVTAIETLPLTETYTNALDYGYTEIFGNEMQPAYWFNSAGQMYRGGYYMQTTDMKQSLINIDAALTEVYGDAMEYNYYSYAGEALSYDSFDQGIDDVADSSAYYYIWFNDVIIDIEVYAERANVISNETVFDVYIVFTDYTYYDYE